MSSLIWYLHAPVCISVNVHFSSVPMSSHAGQPPGPGVHSVSVCVSVSLSLSLQNNALLGSAGQTFTYFETLPDNLGLDRAYV